MKSFYNDKQILADYNARLTDRLNLRHLYILFIDNITYLNLM